MEITAYTDAEKEAWGMEENPQEETSADDNNQVEADNQVEPDSQEVEPVEEESQEESQEEPQEGDNQEEPVEEAPAGNEFADINIPISVTNEDGEEVMEEIPYDQLAKEHNEYQALQTQVESNQQFINDVSPYVGLIKDSKVLQHTLYYLNQGFDEDQVKQGLMNLWQGGQQEGEVQPQGEEPPEYLQKINELEARVIQSEQQLKQQADLTARESIIKANDDVLANAAIKYGADPNAIMNDPSTNRSVRDALNQFYKGVDLTKVTLTQRQANGVMNVAFKGQEKKKTHEQAAEMLRARTIAKKKQAPLILQGRTTNAAGDFQKSALQIDNVSQSDSVQRWQDM